MSERARIVTATLVGAAVGALFGYLFFTPSGRRLRDEIEPRLNEVSRELGRAHSAVTRAFTAIDDGRRSLERLVSEPPRWPEPPLPAEHEVPFV